MWPFRKTEKKVFPEYTFEVYVDGYGKYSATVFCGNDYGRPLLISKEDTESEVAIRARIERFVLHRQKSEKKLMATITYA